MTAQEWQETLEVHRKAMIKTLRAINRGELMVTEAKYASIKRAACGEWHPWVGRRPSNESLH